MSVKYLPNGAVMASLNELKRRERDLQAKIYQLGPKQSPEKAKLLGELRGVQGEISRLEEQSK